MNISVKDSVLNSITYGGIAVILAIGVMMIYPDYLRRAKLQRENAELREKLVEKKRQINELTNNQRRFASDSDFVEQIARQNHRVLPGEYVFIFEKD